MDTVDVPIVLALVFSALTVAYGKRRGWSLPHLALGALLGFLFGPLPILVSLARTRLTSSAAHNS